jgi:hypothetical protein
VDFSRGLIDYFAYPLSPLLYTAKGSIYPFFTLVTKELSCFVGSFLGFIAVYYIIAEY